MPTKDDMRWFKQNSHAKIEPALQGTHTPSMRAQYFPEVERNSSVRRSGAGAGVYSYGGNRGSSVVNSIRVSLYELPDS